MNPIEKLYKRIQAKLPEVQAQLDRPSRADGLWCLDLRLNLQLVVVEWRDGRGFGVSCGEGGYGEGPDEVFSRVSQAEERIRELLTQRSETRPPRGVLLQRLRELRGLTQVQLAARLGIKQASLSRLERGDMHLSTLKRLVASMGGELQIQAVFPDTVIPLLECDKVSRKAPSKSQGKAQA